MILKLRIFLQLYKFGNHNRQILSLLCIITLKPEAAIGVASHFLHFLNIHNHLPIVVSSYN